MYLFAFAASDGQRRDITFISIDEQGNNDALHVDLIHKGSAENFHSEW